MKLHFLRSHAAGKARDGWPTEQIFADLKRKRDLVCSLTSDPDCYVTDQELQAIAVAAGGPQEPAPAIDETRWLKFYPQNPRNIIRGVAEYTLETSWRKQPGFALAAGIGLQAVIAGRKVRDQFDTRTNLNLVIVGHSTAGKDRPRQAMKEVLTTAGGDELIGPDGINSGEGFITALFIRPAMLCCLDEFGRLMEACADDKQNWMRKFATYLLTAYSSANQIWTPNAFAKEEQTKTIHQPNPVVIGTTVPESLHNSMSRQSLSDGFLSRLLIFDEHSVPRKRRPVMDDPPAWLVDRVREWCNFMPGGGDLRDAIPQPMVVPASQEATDRLQAFDDSCEDKAETLGENDGASLWRRASESVSKLALIHACGERFESPQVEVESVEWAAGLVTYLTEHLIETCLFRIGDNQYERDLNSILRIVRDAGPAGIEKSSLTRRTQRLRKRDRDEMLNSLIESKRIVRQARQTATRPADIFKLVE